MAQNSLFGGVQNTTFAGDVTDATTPTKKRKLPHEFDFADTVNVAVGTEKKVFTVAKAALENSGYFSSHADFNDKAGATTLTLADVEEKAFNNYIAAVISGELPKSWSHNKGEGSDYDLCKLWIAGDYLQDSFFCSQVLQVLKSRHQAICPQAAQELPNLACVNMVWEDTDAGCALQRFLLDCYTHLPWGELSDYSKAYSSDFIWDLCQHLLGYGTHVKIGTGRCTRIFRQQ